MNWRALQKLSYGMYIVSANKGNHLNGQIANAVFQVTSEPLLIAASINTKNFTHECMLDGNHFAVSVLAKDTPFKFIGRFGFRCGRDFDKLEGIDYQIGGSGVPIILDNAVAFIEAKVVRKSNLGSHTLFFGEIIDAEIVDADKDVMTYDYYHLVKGGKLSERASHYIKSEE